MAHKLIKLLNSLTNTPHLIEVATLENIISLIEDRNNGIYELAINGSSMKADRTPQYNDQSKIGIVPVDGPLTYIAYAGMCGEDSCSYQQIQEDFDVLCSLGAQTIILDCDGPGGEAFACFETGQYMRTKADELGINLISYVDGLAASATYGIAASAHKIITNAYSELGSIGVVIKLVNANKALQKAGIETTFVSAGDSKIPFTADGGFKKEFIADLQDKVDQLYANFVGYVSEMRGIPENVVRGTEAKVFTAEEAVSLGLADSIMSREEFANFLSDVVQTESPRDNPMLKKLINKNKTVELSTEENEDMKLEDLQASILALTTEFADFKSASAVLLATKDTELTSLQGQLKELTEKLEKADAVVAQTEAAKQEQKLSVRKEALSKVLNAEQAEAAFTALSNVEDAVFEFALGGYTAAAKAEQDDPRFKELGIGGQGSDDKKVSGVEAAAAKKYQTK